MAKRVRRIIEQITEYRGNKRAQAYAAGKIPATKVINTPRGGGTKKGRVKK